MPAFAPLERSELELFEAGDELGDGEEVDAAVDAEVVVAVEPIDVADEPVDVADEKELAIEEYPGPTAPPIVVVLS